MKKIGLRRNSVLLGVLFSIVVFLSSCAITKTPVGEYTSQTGQVYEYARGKQVYVLGFPAGQTSVATPKDGNCEVITMQTFADGLIGGLTGGLVTTYTIKVNAKK